VPAGVVNLVDKLARFSDLWSPRVVAEVNDDQLKLVKIAGEFVWHAHEHADEAFLVLAGSMRIEFRDGVSHLSEGDLCVVPKGTEHRPCADRVCHVLLIEPRGVVNTGDAGSERRAANDVWI
jgi:mannose-6-phosphate isomerase-like protein (cupin superfamily)